MLSQEKGTTIIKGYGDDCFMINNILVESSVLLFPRTFLVWNAKKFEDINAASLAVIPLVFPTLEVLVIGCGKSLRSGLPDDLVADFRKRGISIEQSDTFHAAGMFNMLTLEGRHVAAALLTFDEGEAASRSQMDLSEFER